MNKPDILDRLSGYNPPDRVFEPDKALAEDIQDARIEIESFREKQTLLQELFYDWNKGNISAAGAMYALMFTVFPPPKLTEEEQKRGEELAKKYLKSLEPVKKFGKCLACCEKTNDRKGMYWLTFDLPENVEYTCSICCNKFGKRLKHE